MLSSIFLSFPPRMEEISFPLILSNSPSSSFTFTLPHYSHKQSVIRQFLYTILLECTLDVLFMLQRQLSRLSSCFPFLDVSSFL